ncbi:TonB-dependent receptor plug domain-containing protein [Siansivirga zeaxanthinifaciens]|uniref:TonB-dependent receptor plug domain-containing protein n=1 Tax=Siansivirga zeaxanthinifaciens CC-SAMT-1 TaxID=1454006 RepID=A0A0C5WF14_9FLAO|nr:TonB-dependent receptor plug domain-containing protein [Siansivirga zeaxanthinifaciens]AJR04792.1 hypothetical protein AW14_04970 [Siansivirga zeaxanthinifaciens CC-SAMT-1]
MNNLLKNIKRFFPVIFLLIIFNTKVIAQENKTVPNIEKTYLHTDRDTYFLGETLWFKAYNVYAFNNFLFDNSKVLYVELIAPDSKIIARNKIELVKGIGNGDFTLADSLGVKKPGLYQLRAYTNWNRNFGDSFVFKKEINILNAFDLNNQIRDNNQKKEKASNSKQLKETEAQTFQFDFFPEGGSLIQNVSSIVAFKATDSNGQPILVKGKIFDSNGVLITLFLSLHDGMGKFQFIPKKDMEYHALITQNNGLEIKVPLPKALNTGYVLGYRHINDKSILIIKTNQETLDNNPNPILSFVCKSRGISYLEGTHQITNITTSLQIPTDNFPEGIIQMTLHDENKIPHSERLVYNNKKHDFEVTLNTNKSTYAPNEKAILNLKAKTKSGDVLPASFSVSVTDTNGADALDKNVSTICSYFLMESDIKGRVNNPGYYFDSTNTKRLEHLDLLLLTQGWRDFLWKTIPERTETKPYALEKGISISGRVKQLFGKKAKEGANVTLALMNANGLKIENTETDTLGQFSFVNLYFKGKTNMFLNTVNKKGKAKGEIILYPIDQPPLPINFKTNITVKPIDSTFKDIKEAVLRKYVNYGVALENVLDEVEIIATKKTKTTSLYGIPDYSYVVDEKSPITNDIFQFIQMTIPSVIVDGTSIRFTRYNGAALIILDGFPLNDASQLSYIQPDNVEKIDAIKGPSAAIYGSVAANGVIAIYSKDSTDNVSEKKQYHSISEKVDGFYEAKIFYSPDLNAPNYFKDNKDAVRNTIYWNPYAHLDKTGNFSATFFNTELETKVKVSLEGITTTGVPVVKHTYYSIKKM